jgi:hypothetical protein
MRTVCKWWFTDPRTGRRKITRWLMAEEEARATLIDPEPVESTRISAEPVPPPTSPSKPPQQS